MGDVLLTVVETNAYLAAARGIMSDNERTEVVDMIAADPACGNILRGGNGIRKVRFAVGNRGKSGGVRIIYYYHSNHMPAYLLTVFAKNERSNLTTAEVNQLDKAAEMLQRKLRSTK
jgi:hypothetical protein